MTNKLLWSPKNKDTFLSDFIRINSKYLKNKDYKSLHEWSIKDKKNFWSSVWKFTEIKGQKKEPILENENNFIESNEEN